MHEPCQLCGESEHLNVSHKDRHGNPLDSVVCMGCGVITNDPIPSDEDLARFYKQDYRKEYKGAAEPRMRQVWRNFARQEVHINANRAVYSRLKKCLDLGSGSGEFMFLAKQLGISCKGIEPNEDYSAYTRDKLGLDVLTQTLEETSFDDRSFDLIRLSHVLEHMRQPVRSLKVLHRWLADDGVLYIEVPNIEREAQLKMGGKMFHFGHVFNFNPFTLRLAARLAGFEELPETRVRDANSTGVFLVKAKARFAMPDGAKANAQRMKAAMDEHNSRRVPHPKQGSAIGRFFSTMRTRMGEALAARKFAGHRAIADHFAARIDAASRSR